VKRAVADVRDSAQDAKDVAVRKVRREPFKTLGLAACVGTFTGVLAGFVLGRYTKARR
jgi:ElaB/YqjD/DUF883 family membrane-anchored ribosome-binding protein